MRNDPQGIPHVTDFPSSDAQPPVPRTASPWTIAVPRRAAYPGGPGSKLPPLTAYPGSPAWQLDQRRARQ